MSGKAKTKKGKIPVKFSKDKKKKELQLLKKQFDAIDSNQNGVLDLDEIQTFMSEIGLEESLAPLVFKLFDTNDDGCLSFDEFCQFIKIMNDDDAGPIQLYRLAFDKIDTDHSGSLNKHEVYEFAKLFNPGYKEEDAYYLINMADENNDERLSFEEVVNLFDQINEQ